MYRATSTDPKQLASEQLRNVAKSYNTPSSIEITACSNGDQNVCNSLTVEQANAMNTFRKSGENWNRAVDGKEVSVSGLQCHNTLHENRTIDTLCILGGRRSCTGGRTY